MSIYGDKSVNISQLKQWAKELNIEDILYKIPQRKSYSTDTINRKNLETFLSTIEKLKEGDDWRDSVNILSQSLLTAVFMVSDNAIKVANFYEILIIPSDIATKKKIIKGFDYLDIGYVHLKNEKNCIATIGQKSDLIWTCLYNLFIKEFNNGGIEHTLPAHEEILSLQIFNAYKLNDTDILNKINEILFECSTKLGLNFKVYHIDQHIKEEGISGYFELEMNIANYDPIPILYFNNAFASDDVRMQYLSYYHVIEYFFVRAQNNNILNLIRTGGYFTNPINHNELHKILKKYTNTINERESLKLVLNKAVNVQELKKWLNKSSERINAYTIKKDNGLYLDLSVSDEKIISKLASRIYYYRCSIAHAKGDIDEYIAIPEINNNDIRNEILIIRWVAENVIKKCSTW